MPYNCYNKMNYSYEGRHPPTKLAVMVTTAPTNSFVLQDYFVWLSDTWCNAHITNDLSNLSISTSYNGDDGVQVSTCQSLLISHQGLGNISTTNSSLILSNLFRVPNISKICSLFINVVLIIIVDLYLFLSPLQFRIKIQIKSFFQKPIIHCLYHLFTPKDQAHIIAQTDIKKSYTIWHDRRVGSV